MIVYSNVDSSQLLRGNVEAGRDVLADSGGVAIQAQPDLPERYGDLLLIEPRGVRESPQIGRTTDDSLVRDITFSPPEAYVAGSLREGRSLAAFDDGSPLIATATRGPSRILYYGYIEDASSFKYDFRYPVFWKRAVFHLAGRETLPELNRATGERPIPAVADGVDE